MSIGEPCFSSSVTARVCYLYEILLSKIYMIYDNTWRSVNRQSAYRIEWWQRRRWWWWCLPERRGTWDVLKLRPSNHTALRNSVAFSPNARISVRAKPATSMERISQTRRSYAYRRRGKLRRKVYMQFYVRFSNVFIELWLVTTFPLNEISRPMMNHLRRIVSSMQAFSRWRPAIHEATCCCKAVVPR